uniref:Uncharacterized protein n=1 Tax=Myotis myotis TaxID=51298 RepID=A0A7J7YDM9_MYOMY|nr:hypothetical protein mMyoMyo1_011020 [Myotis myotis]
MRNVSLSSTAFTHIQIQRELQAKVICICEGFLEQPSPRTHTLTADPAHTVGLIQSLHLKVGVCDTATGLAGLHHSQDRMEIGILNGELGEEGMPGLQHMANGGAWWRLYFHLSVPGVHQRDAKGPAALQQRRAQQLLSSAT